MNIFKWVLYFWPFFSITAQAQLIYTFENNVSVIENGVTLTQPFSGGFIAPQYSAIDLNLDGIADLLVFDRASNKIFTYILNNGEYIYSPYYESLFPSGLKSWVLLRDYNCDGKMDLFTSSIFGMSLYENTSSDKLSWELTYQTIYTEGSNGQTNLQVSSLDLPAIVDVDNDGDLDILNYNFATGGGIEFHQNLSVDKTGVCGLDLKRVTRRYGDFEECTCDTYIFGADDCFTGGRVAHSGGKSILSFSYTNSLLHDLLIGQEFCEFPGYLPNTGSLTLAKMESVSFNFPTTINPLRMEYPAFYELDLFNDGSKDILASPNIYTTNGMQNYAELSYQYNKVGNEYKLITNRFLKNEMIDVGHKSSPVFTDIDFDGDEDLLIGSGKNGEGASLFLYENIGSPTQPSFMLKNTDYLEFKKGAYQSIRTQMFDVNNNGFLDLVLTTIVDNQIKTTAFFYSGNPLNPYSREQNTIINLPDLSIWDSPYLYKIGNKTALFVGKQAGNLMYYSSDGELLDSNWNLVNDSYLGIEEDFAKRNLSISIADINANGTEDLITMDDSGSLVAYDDFLNAHNALIIEAVDTISNVTFSLNFGKLATISTANLFSKLEPSLIIGLLTGGIQVLNNTQATSDNKPLKLKLIGYPNPTNNNQLFVQANKSGIARVIDATGKEVIKGLKIEAGVQIKIDIDLLKGIYFLQLVTSTNEKKAIRFVVVD